MDETNNLVAFKRLFRTEILVAILKCTFKSARMRITMNFETLKY